MFLSIKSTLLRMGRFRIGAGIRLKGWTAVFAIFGIGMFYLIWWSLLAAFWCLYGVCYLCFYLPFKGIRAACRRKKKPTPSSTKTATASPANPAPTTPTKAEAPEQPAPEQPAAEQPATPTPVDASQPKVERHRVTGTSYRLDAIKSLMHEDPDYYLSKSQLIEEGRTGERIYKLGGSFLPAVLEPEPDNPQDQNAIKVVVGGVHIGYIKAGSCAHIHKALREGRIENVMCEVAGGDYKILLEDINEDGDSEYTLERDTVPFYAVLVIRIKK